MDENNLSYCTGNITLMGNEPNTGYSFELYQTQSNPFNPTTTIKYSLRESHRVRLTIYSLSGEKIKVLVDEVKPAGMHSVEVDLNDLQKGIYFYSIKAGNNASSKKFMVLK